MLFGRSVKWDALRDHASLLSGSRIVNFVCGESEERRLDFVYLGNRFLVRSQNGHFHLLVDDPQCPDLILYHVGSHFEQLLQAAR